MSHKRGFAGAAVAIALTSVFLLGATKVEQKRPQDFFKNQCGGCHVSPDARFAPDQIWIASLNKTACIGPADDRMRVPLIELFKKSRPPYAVAKIAKVEETKAGRVTGMSGLAAVVENQKGKRFRLDWTLDGAAAMALEPGTYTIRAYSLTRAASKDGIVRGYRPNTAVADDSTWTACVSGNAGVFVVRPGNTLPIPVSDRLLLRTAVEPGAEGVELGASLIGQGGSGASLFRDGARVEFRYTLTSKSGAAVASGLMEYG